MYRDKAASKLHHFRPADGGLEPCAVMKRGVPVIDGRVVTAERDLEIIALLEPDNTALHFHVESSSGRRTGSRVRPGGHTQLAQKADLRREIGVDMQNELPFI